MLTVNEMAVPMGFFTRLSEMPLEEAQEALHPINGRHGGQDALPDRRRGAERLLPPSHRVQRVNERLAQQPGEVAAHDLETEGFSESSRTAPEIRFKCFKHPKATLRRAARHR